MKPLLIVLLAVVAAATQASAQFAPPSGGELGSFVKCFYECKPGPNVQEVATFQEITTLMVANQSFADRTAQAFFIDGQQACVAQTLLDLTPLDLDELNVCHTLQAAGIAVPEAGLVELVIGDPAVPGGQPPFQFEFAEGVYAWGKNVLGKFRVDNPEPFQGRVTGIGKYECRVVPPETGVELAIQTHCDAGVPQIQPILVERTDDQNGLACCNADLDGDGIVGIPDLTILLGCLGLPPTGGCAVADINCDGVIDPADEAILQCQFGGPPDPACCP
jgi:hypothetical protein